MVNKIPKYDKIMKTNKFIVIVPVYNAELYIEKCLESILVQDYGNYDLVVIDDCSTDNTYEIVKRIHDKYNNKFICRQNQVRRGSQLAAFSKGIEIISKDDEDIIVTVDGDDWLSDNGVLSYLNQIYQDENIYMSYGQYEPVSKKYFNYCKQVHDFRNYRKSAKWVTSHLRTFKRKIWNLIDDADMRDVDGEYYKFCGDNVLMYPLLEMCGEKHTKFINKVLYIYNDMNPISEMYIYQKEQARVVDIIKNKKEYKELDT